MEKVDLPAVGRPADPAAGDALRDALLGQVGRPTVGVGVRGLTLNVHDGEAAPRRRPLHRPAGEAPHVAQVSVWLDCYEQRSAVEEALAATRSRSGRATWSSSPSMTTTAPPGTHRPAHWADGQRSPGVLTVALIHRPDGLGYREWITRWHGTQSPVSAELQPRTRYVRNEVVRSLSEGAPEIDGIVEEGWPSTAHVADPLLFFNATTPEELDANVARMMASVEACLDLARLRSYDHERIPDQDPCG